METAAKEEATRSPLTREAGREPGVRLPSAGEPVNSAPVAEPGDTGCQTQRRSTGTHARVNTSQMGRLAKKKGGGTQV